MSRISILVIAIALLFSSCHEEKNIAISTQLTGSVWNKNVNLISEAMSERGWQIMVDHGPESSEESPWTYIQNREVDFAIVPNSRLQDQGNIRAVAPLNQEAMIFLYKDHGENHKSLKELIHGKKLLLPERSSGALGLVAEVFATLEIDSADYLTYHFDWHKFNEADMDWKNKLDSLDVLVLFSQLNNPLVKNILNLGWKISPLGDINSINRGSLIEAICIKYPWAFPMVIPKNVFGNHQPTAVYTLGIQSLLISHKDIDSDLVYHFLKDFYTSLPTMSQQNVAFAQISENYNKASISYPMHDGAIRYMNRDQPTIVERYAELIALIVSLVVITAGVINRYVRKLSRDKKDFIDDYYDELLVAKDLSELNNVRLRAIKQLQAEKLVANESFLIFLQLFEQRKDELG